MQANANCSIVGEPLSREDSIAMLCKQEIAKWNKLREEHPNWVPNLREADFTSVNFELPHLNETDIQDANDFWGANFRKASLQGAIFTNAKLPYCSFEGAHLRGSKLNNAQLYRANFHGAFLNNAVLDDSKMSYTNFENADVTDISYKRIKTWRGIRVATSYGNMTFRRFAQDEDFLTEFRESGMCQSLIYEVWKLTCNCGRSMVLWILWSLFLAFYFALNYWLLGEDAFLVAHLPVSFITFFYYSVVTFTTLGFGDVIPKTELAACWVMAEVILGYVMLGGLISIFADKLARRS